MIFSKPLDLSTKVITSTSTEENDMVTKIVKKISYHFAIPEKDIYKVLESKDER